ncbi:hypothetical protein QJS10_CPA09g01699 [Acorus calamus]|uniref:Uncharacterized protein n=1 Tax=Acorus calamus TaxID=4465 RepID=A0AAV9E3Q5_ACOCL|nr:hypothetical protein QJS10_CPA09g01699 [Acorus calamus]
MLVVVGDTRGLRVLLCHLSIPPNQSSYAFNVIVKQVLGVAPDEPQSTEILEDFLTFMKGFISFPYIFQAHHVQELFRYPNSDDIKMHLEERKYIQ